MQRFPKTRKHLDSRRRRLLAERLETRRLLAGPYAPAAGEAGSTAIAKDDAGIVAWATTVAQYAPGSEVNAEFQDADKALGPAEGTVGDVVSLGRGGQITLMFEDPIRDGLGPDFAVFENSITDTFLELAFVEVSSNGIDFFRFANDSLTPSPVGSFGAVDPTDVHNLAGKYRQGFGTPLDLEELAGVSPLLDTTHVTHVRVIDIVGDGTQSDTTGDPIYDPFPTVASAGFDLDAIGVIHQAEFSRDVIGFEDVGASLAAESAFSGPDPDGNQIKGPFDENVIVGSFQSETLSFNNAYTADYGDPVWNGWAYSNATDTTTPGFTNEFSSYAGQGAAGSATFGVGFVDQNPCLDPGSCPNHPSFFAAPTISREPSDTRLFDSLMVTNTTYAALSMRDGDSFAKEFGGPSGDDPDFFLLTITGKDSTDASIGTVEFYLADFRFTDNSLDYIVDTWVEVDLSPVAAARSLEFSLSSSDVGPFGMNTPAFFAADEITLTTPVLPIDIADRTVGESDGAGATLARISRSDSDMTRAIDVTLAPIDPNVALVPTSVRIPVGQPYVEFPIDTVDNDLVDGDRQITIQVSADGFAPGSRALVIQDDDVPTLTFAVNQSSVLEGESLTATLRRNDADLSASLTVLVESALPSLLAVPESVVIPAQQSSTTVTITATEDAIDRPQTTVSVSASATNYVGGNVSIDVLDNDSPAVVIEVDATTLSESDAAPSARFEDLGKRLAPESFHNGADQAGGFQSDGLDFNNQFDPTFGSWLGWSYSNVTDTTTPGFSNQYSAFPGGGATGSDTYGVATAFPGQLAPTITRDPLSTNGFDSIAISNTTYAALSMAQGDDFAKQFGGPTGDDPDFFLLTIEGFDSGDVSVGTIEFYLADYRFADSSRDYIIDTWTNVDLSAVSDAVELRFSLSSSDVGSFGMNTPAYFAVDNVVLLGQTPDPQVTIRRNTADVSEELAVSLASDDETEAALPPGVTIPAGASLVDVPLNIVNDALVDGDQVVTLRVTADAHSSSVAEVTIRDDDRETLSLTVTTPTLDEAQGVGRAVLHRNVDDASAAFTVDLSADVEGQLMLPASVTIPDGQRSVAFEFAAVDNAIVDGDRTVLINAEADGFSPGQDAVLILNEDVPPPTLTLEIEPSSLSESDAPPTARLEDVGATMPEESFYNGADLAGGFTSDGVRFNNTFDPTFGTWGGWSASNATDVTTTGFENQYSAIAGAGARGSATYAVASGFPGGTIPTVTIDNPPGDQSFESMMVTNTTYVALSMAQGDAFAKKFGGPTGDDPDFFLLTIEGRDQAGLSVGAIDFYLADFRFEDNGLDYIVDDWTTVDVSGLVGATQLEFSLSSSDVGMFGMNTPAYFAVDNLVLSGISGQAVARATVTRGDTDLSQPVVVQIDVDDDSEVSVPETVTLEPGERTAAFDVRAVDDAVLDGDRVAQLTVSAPTHQSGSATLTIEDNDLATLTTSLSLSSVVESDGASATQLIVHRNTEDNSQSLEVALSTASGDLAIPETVVLQAGARAATVDISIADNVVLDGDRIASLDAEAVAFPRSTVDLAIVDDELAELVIQLTAEPAIIREGAEQQILSLSLASQPMTDVVVEGVVEMPNPSLSNEFVLTPPLAFTPENWSQPQAFSVQAIGDLLLEQDQEFALILQPHSTTVDALYQGFRESIAITLQDFQPQTIRVSEDSQGVHAKDEPTGTTVASGSLEDGISVIANDLAQTVTLEALPMTQGAVELELRGEDDSAILQGDRFTRIDGGPGHDRLVLELPAAVELTRLVHNRVADFEEVALSDESMVTVDASRLADITSNNVGVFVRKPSEATLQFSEGADSEVEMVMIGDEAAQVMRSDSHELRVISQMPWQNVVRRWDVNNNNQVSASDALAVINSLSQFVPDPLLPKITSLDVFGGLYLDVSGDGRASALDALQVINELSRQDLARESERVEVAPLALSRKAEPGWLAETIVPTLNEPTQKVYAASTPNAVLRTDTALVELYGADENDTDADNLDASVTEVSLLTDGLE